MKFSGRAWRCTSANLTLGKPKEGNLELEVSQPALATETLSQKTGKKGCQDGSVHRGSLCKPENLVTSVRGVDIMVKARTDSTALSSDRPTFAVAHVPTPPPTNTCNLKQQILLYLFFSSEKEVTGEKEERPKQPAHGGEKDI